MTSPIRTAVLFSLLAALLCAAAGSASACKPGCRAQQVYSKESCPWAFCRFQGCTYWKGGKKRWGFECKSKAPPPPPMSKCANKCYAKWRDAKKDCTDLCQIKGCPLGNGKWGFRCAPKPVTKPSPSASPSPIPEYPKFCPTECRKNRKRVVVLCNPKLCKVTPCRRRKRGPANGFRCTPLKPSPSPSSTPTPSPSVSTSPLPLYPPYCPVKCRRNRRRVVSECNPKICKVKNCRNDKKWWKWGYQCLPKMEPSPKPVGCENKCYPKWRQANKGCKWVSCRVAWCGQGKGYRCAPLK